MGRISTWPGRDIRRLKGVVRQRRPSAIPRDSFQDLQNVDWRGVVLRERPGQAKVNSAGAMAAAVDFMVDARDVGNAIAGAVLAPAFFPGAAATCTPAASERLYIIGGGDAVNEAIPYYYDGATLAPLGTPGDGEVHVIMFIPGGTCLIVGTSPYSGAPAFSEVRKLSPSTGGTSAWFTISDNTSQIDAILYVDPDEEAGPDSLLIGLFHGAGSGNRPGIYRTNDAVNLTLELDTDSLPGSGSQCHVHLAKHPVTGHVFASLYDSPTSVNYGLFERTPGGGSYTRIPIDNAAGQIDSGTYIGIQAMGVHVTNIADDQGVYHVYLFGRSSIGTTLVGVYPLAADPTKVKLGLDTGGASSGRGVCCAEDFDGVTYFGYGDDASGAAIAKVTWIAGVQSWTSVVYNFSSNFPADSLDTIVSLRAWNGSLYALGWDSTSPSKTFLYKSAGLNVASWSKVGELVNAGVPGYALSQVANRHMQVA